MSAKLSHLLSHLDNRPSNKLRRVCFQLSQNPMVRELNFSSLKCIPKIQSYGQKDLGPTLKRFGISPKKIPTTEIYAPTFNIFPKSHTELLLKKTIAYHRTLNLEKIKLEYFLISSLFQNRIKV